ncbi:MAG: 5-oxoprolinase subunit PxpA [Candidatus Symbiobacter sp.]|nr:5-oxoprolinase subunit PxpA [Candidatus Symbiobacter sp.]
MNHPTVITQTGGKKTINCDMGEGFSLYHSADDEAIMPYITLANIACGFHAGDFNHMRKTVRLAKQFNVLAGAHPSLPDLQGFGRREMKMERDELANCLIYQVGALVGMLQAEGLRLNHIKPHGALFGMATRHRHVAEAVADAAVVFGVPVIGMEGSLHQTVYQERGVSLIPEYYCDLDYDDEGMIMISRIHDKKDTARAAQQTLTALRDGYAEAKSGKKFTLKADTVCVHSDSPNSVEVAKAVYHKLRENGLLAVS